MEDIEQCYVDYDAFLNISFSAVAFANTLVNATNNASDVPVDLTTPLSRVLFDVQEIDSHIDQLANRSAFSLLDYTKKSVQKGEIILQTVDIQIASLTATYRLLQDDIIARHDAAERLRQSTDRLWHTLKIARHLSTCVAAARQLETLLLHVNKLGEGANRNGDFRPLVAASSTLVSMKSHLKSIPSEGRADMVRGIKIVRSLESELMEDAEKMIIGKAELVIGQFSASSLTKSGIEPAANTQIPFASAFLQVEQNKTRMSAALIALYSLSFAPDAYVGPRVFEPVLMTTAISEYVKRAVSASVAGLASALSTFSRLDRALLDVSARCQNLVALEWLLESTPSPLHTLPISDNDPLQRDMGKGNLLQPMLHSLDTSSLPSFFWRSLASQLSPRVQRIVRETSASARALQSNKDKIRDAIKECVYRGSHLPTSIVTKIPGKVEGNWEREAAVMIGSINNALRR